MKPDCIEHQGAMYDNGYGAARWGDTVTCAHRIAYCKAHGLTLADIEGLMVLHDCDYRPCINPAHLLLGTQKDNMQDMLAKGRGRPSRLKPNDVEQVKAKLAAGESLRAIAAQFGVCHSQIAKVKAGKRRAINHV